jgi:hypothetical protein
MGLWKMSKILLGRIHPSRIFAARIQVDFRLWEPGHKERYYEQKFHVDYHEDIEFRQTYLHHINPY